MNAGTRALIAHNDARRTDTWPIGDRMREARRSAGFSQRRVAAALSVSERAVREWESGRRKPRIDILDAYLRLVGGSITLGA